MIIKYHGNARWSLLFRKYQLLEHLEEAKIPYARWSRAGHAWVRQSFCKPYVEKCEKYQAASDTQPARELQWYEAPALVVRGVAGLQFESGETDSSGKLHVEVPAWE